MTKPSALALLALMAASGCRSHAERSREAELERVAALVQRLRDADNRDKAPHLAALRAQACSVEEVCGLQSACVEAYAVHERALAAIGALEQLARADAGSPAQVQERFREAERELELARRLTADCASSEARLVRALR